MTWEAVARKDFQDALRSYWLWGLSLLFVVFFAAPALFFADRVGNAVQQQGGQLSTDQFLTVLSEINAFFVPIIAIVVAYAAIAGERDSGTLKLLLSLPHSRLDVVAGKVVGRGVVVVLPVLLGFVAAGIAFLATPVSFGAGNYVLFALLTSLLAVVFVSLAVGISAGARSSRRAMIGTVSAYVILTLFWNRFADGLTTLLSDYAGMQGQTLVPVHLFVKVLNPTQAYKTLVTTTTLTLPGDATISREVAARVRMLGGAGIQGQLNQQMYAQALGETVPFYLSDPFVFLLLLAWIVVPCVAGYLVFREADL